MSALASQADTDGLRPASPRGHAHNDYVHKRPLLDALENGFYSAEADVFLVDGDLLLGHGRDELRPGRNLVNLYLKPLAERIEKRGGWVHEPGQSFHLLVDFKTDGKAAYELLQEQIAPYKPLLTKFSDGNTEPGPITIILTSAKPLPQKQITSGDVRWVGCDGRVADLAKLPEPHLIPWISDNWGRHFAWRGDGPVPEADRQKLERLVRQAHANGQAIRFWAAPDNPESWKLQREAGVDWINTDKLAPFAAFLEE